MQRDDFSITGQFLCAIHYTCGKSPAASAGDVESEMEMADISMAVVEWEYAQEG